MKQPRKGSLDLWQVVVEERSTKGIQAVGPAMIRSACEHLAHTMQKEIAAGRERQWANPHVIPARTIN